MLDLWIGVTAVGGREIFHLGRKPAHFEFAYVNHHGTGNPVFKNTDPIVFWNPTEHKFQLQGFLASPTQDGVAIFSGPFGTNFEKELLPDMTFGMSPGLCCVEIAGLPHATVMGYLEEQHTKVGVGDHQLITPPGHAHLVKEKTLLTITEANHALQAHGIKATVVGAWNIADLIFYQLGKTVRLVFTNGEWVIVPHEVGKILSDYVKAKHELDGTSPGEMIKAAKDILKKNFVFGASDSEKATQALADKLEEKAIQAGNPPDPVLIDVEELPSEYICWDCNSDLQGCLCGDSAHPLSKAEYLELSQTADEFVADVKALTLSIALPGAKMIWPTTKHIGETIQGEKYKAHPKRHLLVRKAKIILGLV